CEPAEDRRRPPRRRHERRDAGVRDRERDTQDPEAQRHYARAAFRGRVRRTGADCRRRRSALRPFAGAPTERESRMKQRVVVIATGSYPFVPPVAGSDRRDCFVYRTIEDLEMITARAARSKVGTVIGGGLLGLEAAKALKDLGLETHIVEFASRLMAVQLDDS